MAAANSIPKLVGPLRSKTSGWFGRCVVASKARRGYEHFLCQKVLFYHVLRYVILALALLIDKKCLEKTISGFDGCPVKVNFVDTFTVIFGRSSIIPLEVMPSWHKSSILPKRISKMGSVPEVRVSCYNYRFKLYK